MAVAIGLLEVKKILLDCYDFLILHPILIGFAADWMI